MKVLMLNHNVVWRSAFNRCFQMARFLVRGGYDLTLITNSPSARFVTREYTRDGVKVVEMPDLFWGQLRTGWDPWNTLHRILFLAGINYDLVHAFDTRPTVIFPALFLRKRYGIPLVIDWGDWWGRGGAIELRSPRLLNKMFEGVETFFEEHYKLKADLLTTVSYPLKQRAEGLGIQPSQIVVIPNGADAEGIMPIDREFARAELNISKVAKVVAFSGFVLYDLEFVLKAFRIVSSQMPNSVLLLTGATSSISRKLAGDLFEDGKIIETGFLSRQELNVYLGATDVCLLPLRNNTANRARYPGKFGDYIAAGRPVVMNAVGDIEQLFHRHPIGLLSEDTPEDFAQKVIFLLSRPETMREYGQAARRLAEGDHSWASCAQMLDMVYQRAAN